jgi:hypothetical protein
MSRTDAHRPAWVQQFDPTVPSSIHHDHADGRCVEETLEYARWYAGTRAGRNHHCKKWEWITEECPHNRKRDYVRESPCAVIRRQWSGYYWRRRVAVPTWEPPFEIKPHEHRVRIVHEDWPCDCDDFPETPTCDLHFDMRYSHYASTYYGDSIPAWYLNATWHGPERRRERDDLRMLAREYNAHGDLEDGDFDCPQARHRAGWSWW